METELKECLTELNFKDKYGLSKKTNIAIVGIAAIQFAKDSMSATVAISVIVMICVFLQYSLDKKANK